MTRMTCKFRGRLASISRVIERTVLFSIAAAAAAAARSRGVSCSASSAKTKRTANWLSVWRFVPADSTRDKRTRPSIARFFASVRKNGETRGRRREKWSERDATRFISEGQMYPLKKILKKTRRARVHHDQWGEWRKMTTSQKKKNSRTELSPS